MTEAISWAARHIRNNLTLLLALAALAGLGWSLAARGLVGRRRALWLLVPPLFAVTSLCWAGPGRLFPKEPFEGPSLLHVAPGHSVTLLDLPGALCAVAAVALGGWLLLKRLRDQDD